MSGVLSFTRKASTQRNLPWEIFIRLFAQLPGSAFKLPCTIWCRVRHEITLFPVSFAQNLKSLKGPGKQCLLEPIGLLPVCEGQRGLKINSCLSPDISGGVWINLPSRTEEDRKRSNLGCPFLHSSFGHAKEEPGYGVEPHIDIKQIKYCVYNYCTSNSWLVQFIFLFLPFSFKVFF